MSTKSKFAHLWTFTEQFIEFSTSLKISTSLRRRQRTVELSLRSAAASRDKFSQVLEVLLKSQDIPHHFSESEYVDEANMARVRNQELIHERRQAFEDESVQAQVSDTRGEYSVRGLTSAWKDSVYLLLLHRREPNPNSIQ